MLSYVLKEPIINFYLNDKRVIDSSKIKLFYSLISERINFVPLQYLTGKVEFYESELLIKKGVFIPRPETEILVEEVLGICSKYSVSTLIKVLDIGVGSGNISVSIAKKIKKIKITGIDISSKAIRVASNNSKLQGVNKKIEFRKNNLFPEDRKKYHIIVSNPPYISNSDMMYLPEEVKKEPVTALKGGVKGIDVLKVIIQRADKFLVCGGYLVLEIGEGQIEFLKQVSSCMKLVGIRRDLSGIERCLIYRKGV